VVNESLIDGPRKSSHAQSFAARHPQRKETK
jgi:hypothetical protein